MSTLSDIKSQCGGVRCTDPSTADTIDGGKRLQTTANVTLATGIVLLAIAVHSLFYADFFEDPMTWALLGLVGLSARVPKKRQPAPPVKAAASLPTPAAPEPARTSP